jgi:hypothetical protein
MELVALPLLLAFLLLWIPGLRLAIKASRSEHGTETPASVWIVFGVCAAFVVGLGAPLLILHHRALNMWMLLLWMTLEYAVAAIVGLGLIVRFRSNGKRTFLIAASTLFIAVGLYPVTWFTVIGPLITYLGIERTG